MKSPAFESKLPEQPAEQRTQRMDKSLDSDPQVKIKRRALAGAKDKTAKQKGRSARQSR
jgi:hypothetical protein